MDIKIPTGIPAEQNIKALDDVSNPQEVVQSEALREAPSAAGLDRIGQIAEQIASGEITKDQAEERLLAEVMDSKLIQSAPPDVRASLIETLKTLLETDPHLLSLTALLGIGHSDS